MQKAPLAASELRLGLEPTDQANTGKTALVIVVVVLVIVIIAVALYSKKRRSKDES